ncbi:MAG: hypothetical protein LR011_07100, partial [Verrucomicrobia bacterium]|nr:hypothetical protein [Verrucomicrobiota bacterium]
PLSISNSDSRYYTQFWINAVRWLSANKFLSEKDVLEWSLSKTYFPPDVDIKAVLKMKDGSEPASQGHVSIQLLKGDQIIESDLSPTRNGPKEYEVTFRLSGPGEFRLQAMVELKNGVKVQASRLVVCESGYWETMDARCNPTLLEDVANWSGGQFIRADADSSSFMAQLGIKDLHTDEFTKSAVWDRWWWLIAVLGLLSTEWFIRKRSGLV